jgi:hypothetical protein
MIKRFSQVEMIFEVVEARVGGRALTKKHI